MSARFSHCLACACTACVSRVRRYEVLDVPKDCNAVQIKAAFRRLALLWHPDKHEGESADEIDYAVRV